MSKYGFAEIAGISDSEIEAAIAADAKVDAGLNAFMKSEIVPYWKGQAPVRTGEYAGDIKVTKKARGGQGQVGDKDRIAHLIEFGTGGSSPTPEFAPARKTASHFGGTINAKGASHAGSDSRKSKGKGKSKGKSGSRRRGHR